MAIKDNIDVRETPTRAGSTATSAAPADADAAVVTRLRRRGFVPGPRTAMDEFAFTTFGPGMRNPYDESRIVGGSSGGSAIAVATGDVCVATGTDTGGSVRIPAAYCGIVGFKPTFGRIPTTGVVPLSWTLDHVGILGCSIDAVAEVAAATMTLPPFVRQATAADGVPLSRLRIGRPDDDLLAATHPDVRLAYEHMLDSLRNAGATVVAVTLPSVEAYAETHMNILLAEAAHYHRSAYDDLSKHGSDIRRYIEVGTEFASGGYLEAQRQRSTMIERVDAAFTDIDLLALPTTPTVAPAHDQRLTELGDGTTVDILTASIWYTHLFNHTGMPALSLPAPSGGLPIGVQFVAAREHDEFLLQATHSVESNIALSSRDQ